MDRQKLEPRRTPTRVRDAAAMAPRPGVTVPVRPRVVLSCESCTSLTSASRWSARTHPVDGNLPRARLARTRRDDGGASDTATPARDPFAFYGLAPHRGLADRAGGGGGPPAGAPCGYLTFALGRALGRARQDLIFTRRPRAGSLLLRVPRGVARAGRLRGARLAAEPPRRCRISCSGARARRAGKLARLAARDARVWKTGADGYVTITAGLTGARARFGAAAVAVNPDGCDRPTHDAPGARRTAAAAHPTPPCHDRLRRATSIHGKAVDLVIERSPALHGYTRADRRRPPAGTGPGRVKAFGGAARSAQPRDLHRPAAAADVAARCRGRTCWCCRIPRRRSRATSRRR
jgi:hypothetical protein